MVDEAVRVFHVSPARARAWVRRFYAGFLAFYVAVELGMVGWTLATTPAAHRLRFWLPSALIMGVFTLVILRGAGRSARRLVTYQLTMGPNVLRMVQEGLVPTELFRRDVTRIVELSSALRIVYGDGRFVGVPRFLEG